MNISDNILWGYKSFNMANELDIAGEFIYDGIQALNEISCIEESASLFSFSYHISVGIERLQKIIVVLCENITMDDYEEFEKSLITHSHSGLSERIAKYMTRKLNAKENEFLQVLTVFYKKAIYNRFNVIDSRCEEVTCLSSFVEKYSEKNDLKYSFISNKIIVDEKIRELLGRVIGNLSKKYYHFLKEKAYLNSDEQYVVNTYAPKKEIHADNYMYNKLGINMDKVGMAWMIDSENNFVWHNGATSNFNSYIAFNKEKNTGVVVLSNLSPNKKIPATVIGGKMMQELCGN